MLNYDLLNNNIETYTQTFKTARPFRHLVIDNFLLPEIAREGFENFPKMEEMDVLKDFRQYKAQDPAVHKFHTIFKEIIFQHLQSQRFLNIVSKITEIPALCADPQLYASGLAQGGDKSFLNVHIDNSSHPVNAYYRRLNLLIYLNKNWQEEKGGHLELWNRDLTESVAILPAFNRAVFFATDKYSWHGYRQVNASDGDTRKSINLYYFTEQSPDRSQYYHITSFRARPEEQMNKLLYPVDNMLRSLVRKLRPNKDGHAILFDSEKTPK
ncbi:MAG: 2OG-Fe(II) oxygenase [Cyanobacteria bacterium SBLK]|nr:2OG-Fe(II) oxygenase [Cyanobacteria bacterium SBLK]